MDAEQQNKLAKSIYTAWMKDDHWRMAHLHLTKAPQDYSIAYFWAELAASAALDHQQKEDGQSEAEIMTELEQFGAGHPGVKRR